jgi:hypothetical protein
VLKIPSEEISRRVGKIVWAKSFSVGKIFEEISKSPSMEGVSEGASGVPVHATLVPPRFFRDAFRFFCEPQETQKITQSRGSFGRCISSRMPAALGNERAPSVFDPILEAQPPIGI